ncbi:MAG: glycosyltransferase [Proteobacteria bacterium]|nr:glycosyltransferase [Pseudomonadota bacterium]
MKHSLLLQETSNDSTQKMVSIVISAYNEQGNVVELYQRLLLNLKKCPQVAYELIFINDGSSDNTLPILIDIANNDEKVTIVNLTRNFGHEIAMTAGMDYAKGDAVLFMDADLQHPPEIVPQIIEKWLAGHSVVLTKISNNQEKSWFRSFIVKCFYKIINFLSETHIPASTPDFRLINKKYVEALKAMREDSRMFRGMLNWLGINNYAEITFEAPKRFSGETHYNLSKSFSLAINAILQFSIKPLRISIIFSIICAIFSALFGFYTIYEHFASNKSASGYATTICLIVFLSSLQFMILAIIGEYIGRIHIESKGRPLYFAKIISSKKNAS